MHGTRTRMDDYKWSLEFFEKKRDMEGLRTLTGANHHDLKGS